MCILWGGGAQLNGPARLDSAIISLNSFDLIFFGLLVDRPCLRLYIHEVVMFEEGMASVVMRIMTHPPTSI